MPDPRDKTLRWKKLRLRIIARDGKLCAFPDCQVDMSEPGMTTVDHITEVRDGGLFWDPNNLRVVCRPHNQAKGLASTAQRSVPTSPNA